LVRWAPLAAIVALYRLYSMRGFFFFQAEDGIRDFHVTGVQTCALPISAARGKKVEDELENIWRRWGLYLSHQEAVTLEGEPGKRSEERRVGKECRSRRSPDHQKKKEQGRGERGHQQEAQVHRQGSQSAL